MVVTGATQLRNVFAADKVPGIIQAYMEGVKVALALPIAGNGIAFLVSVWILISSRKNPDLTVEMEKETSEVV